MTTIHTVTKTASMAKYGGSHFVQRDKESPIRPHFPTLGTSRFVAKDETPAPTASLPFEA
ncbi:hypothetical protein GCM10027567_19060 [Spongiibacter taiwanensis]